MDRRQPKKHQKKTADDLARIGEEPAASWGAGKQIRCQSVSILIWSCLYGASALAGTNLETERAIGTVIIIDNEKRVLEEAGTQPSAPGHLPEPSEPEAVETTISHNVAVLPQIGYNPQAGIILGQQCKLHRL